MARILTAINGKAPDDAQIGDIIVTKGGAYRIKGGTKGAWQSELVDKTYGTAKSSYVSGLSDNYLSLNNDLYNNETEIANEIKKSGENLKTQLDGKYEGLKKGAYVERMRQENNLPELLALTGKTGGLSETSALGVNQTYANRVSDIDNKKMNDYTNIDNLTTEQLTALKRDYANKNLSAKQSYINSLLNAQQQEEQNKIAMEQQKAENDAKIEIAKINAYKAKTATPKAETPKAETPTTDKPKITASFVDNYVKDLNKMWQGVTDVPGVTLNPNNKKTAKETANTVSKNALDTVSSGNYKLNPYAKTWVISDVLDNAYLTDDEKYKLLINLGITDDDIDKFSNNVGVVQTTR